MLTLNKGTLGLLGIPTPAPLLPLMPGTDTQPKRIENPNYHVLSTIPAGLYPVAEHHRAPALRADAFYTVRYHRHSITHGAFFADVYLFGDADRILATICSAAAIIKDRDNPRWIDTMNEIAGPAFSVGRWVGHCVEWHRSPPRSPHYITDGGMAPNFYVIKDEDGHAFVSFADYDDRYHDDLAGFFANAPTVVQRIVETTIFVEEQVPF